MYVERGRVHVCHLNRVFMNIPSSREVERCPEGNEVQMRKVFMIRAQEPRKWALIMRDVCYSTFNNSECADTVEPACVKCLMRKMGF